MNTAKAKRAGRVPFRGTWVTPKGLQVYELLGAGMPMSEVARTTGTSIGTMSDYVKRAVRLGVMTAKNKKRVICAVSDYDGTRYRCQGKREVEEVMGVVYTTAYEAAKHGRHTFGFHWYFEG